MLDNIKETESCLIMPGVRNMLDNIKEPENSISKIYA